MYCVLLFARIFTRFFSAIWHLLACFDASKHSAGWQVSKGISCSCSEGENGGEVVKIQCPNVQWDLRKGFFWPSKTFPMPVVPFWDINVPHFQGFQAAPDSQALDICFLALMRPGTRSWREAPRHLQGFIKMLLLTKTHSPFWVNWADCPDCPQVASGIAFGFSKAAEGFEKLTEVGSDWFDWLTPLFVEFLQIQKSWSAPNFKEFLLYHFFWIWQFVEKQKRRKTNLS